jgi:hypothetical protein
MQAPVQPRPQQLVRLVLSALGVLAIAALAATSCVDRSRLIEQTPTMQRELEQLQPIPGAAVLTAETQPGVDSVAIEAAYGVAQPSSDLAAHYSAQFAAQGWRVAQQSALDSVEAPPLIYCKAQYQADVRWVEYRPGETGIYRIAIRYGSAAARCAGQGG